MGDVQGSEDENTHQGGFLVPSHLETADDGDGEEEDEYVKCGVPGCVSVPERRSLEAVSALDGFVPVELDGFALEGCGEGEGDEGRPDGVDCQLADGAEAGVAGEDVEVEVEEGEFGEGDEHFVEDLVDVEVLASLLVGFKRNKKHAACHARLLNVFDAIMLDQVLNVVAETPPKHC